MSDDEQSRAPVLTRRRLLIGMGSGALAALTAASAQNGNGGGSALGGAAPGQDVGVIAYFVVLDGEQRSLSEADGPYNGIDLFGECDLMLEDGDAITLEDTPQ